MLVGGYSTFTVLVDIQPILVVKIAIAEIVKSNKKKILGGTSPPTMLVVSLLAAHVKI